MKKLLYLTMLLLLAIACSEEKKEKPTNALKVSEAVGDIASGDSTIYGICGKGTMMHTLQLVTDRNDTIIVNINDEDTEDGEAQNVVVGGMMCGDRMAVLPTRLGDEIYAEKVINLTSLHGRWISLDKSFTIEEDGRVSSDITGETNVWTEWRIFNGRLLLNKDTFNVINISADTLSLENNIGIYEYRRFRR